MVGEIGPDHPRVKTECKKIVFDAQLFREWDGHQHIGSFWLAVATPFVIAFPILSELELSNQSRPEKKLSKGSFMAYIEIVIIEPEIIETVAVTASP